MKHKFPRVLGSQDLRKKYYPNPKTNIFAPENGCLEDDPFLFGAKGQFLRCQLAVSFRDATCFQQHVPPPKQPDLHLIKHNCWTPRHWWYSQGRCGWSAFCCLSLSSSENHGGWNHMLVRRKASILADCCHSFKKSWTLYLQLVPSSYHWTFLLAWNADPNKSQGSVPLLYRCTQDLYETKLRNPLSWWFILKASKVRNLWANTHIQTPMLRLFQVWSYISSMLKKGEGQEQKQEKSPWYLRCLESNLSPWNLSWRVTEFCHPDTSKGGDLLRFDNSETLHPGKVT